MNAPPRLPAAEDHAAQLCVHCPKMCRHACPVSNEEARETTTPWGKMSVAFRLSRGALDPAAAARADGAPAPGGGAPTDPLWSCTDCLLCQTYCTHGNDVPRALRAARGLTAAAGAAPEGARRVRDAVAAGLGPGRTPLADRARAAVPARYRGAASGAPERAEARSLGQVGVWLGCALLSHFPEDVALTLSVIERALGRTPRVLDGDPATPVACCGLPLLEGGFVDDFRAHAARLSEALAAFDTIVSPDPGCVVTLRTLSAEHGVDVRPRALHLAELPGLEPRPNHATRAAVAYHEPCQLGRGLGVREQPRRLIEQATGFAPLEPLPWSGAASYCSGGGGGLPHTAPETAAGIANERARQLEATGARAVVTACPGARRMLRKALPKRIAVLDLVHLL